MTPPLPRRQSRFDFERELAAKRNQAGIPGRGSEREFVDRMERKLARLRGTLAPDEFEKMRLRFEQALQQLRDQLRRDRRRPPREGGMLAPVEPPRGPLPMSGGAAAPLEFDE